MIERIAPVSVEKPDPLLMALAPILEPRHFAHVTQEYRGKVARDLKAHLTSENQWDYSKFNALNDYQRHLYALFLRLAGIPKRNIWTCLWLISVDVSEGQRHRYIEDLLCSSLVGFETLTPREPMGITP